MIRLIKANCTDIDDPDATCPYVLKYGQVLSSLFHEVVPKVFYLDVTIPSEYVQYIITSMDALLFSSHWVELIITHDAIYNDLRSMIDLDMPVLPIDAPHHIKLVWVERLLNVFVETCTYNRPLANMAIVACINILSSHYSNTADIGRYNNWMKKEAMIFNTTKQVTGKSDIGTLKRGVVSILDALGTLKMTDPLDVELSQLCSVVQGVAIQWVWTMSDTFKGELKGASTYAPKMKYLTNVQIADM